MSSTPDLYNKAMSNLVVSETPWELHDYESRKIWVKREDLSCPAPGPGFSKIRGIEQKIRELQTGMFPVTAVGVVDTRHSKAGWGVAYICHALGIPCHVYYPEFREEEGKLRPYQRIASEQFRAELWSMIPTKSAVLFYRAKKVFNLLNPGGYMMPNGLKLSATVEATSRELITTASVDVLNSESTWVVSVSSGTIAAGVLRGLIHKRFTGELILHLGYSRPRSAVMKYVLKKAGKRPRFRVFAIDEGYDYKDAVAGSCPFPCNPFYDRKAWNWIKGNPAVLNGRKVVFWNIGN